MEPTRIIVVEDDRIISEHLQELLTQLGYEIVAAVPSGEQAVEIAEQTQPDLVIMDVVLEGEIDGIEAADMIRSRLDIPVVYLTAYSDERTLDRAKKTAPWGYLLKPYRKEALRTTIEMAVATSKLERKLRESERKYRSLAELLPEIVYEIDLEGRFVFVNKSGFEVFGYTSETAPVGFSIFDAMVPEDRPTLVAELQKALEGKHVPVLEFSARSHGGRTIPLMIHARPIKEGAAIVGIRGIAIDITEQKRVQEVLLRANEELESRVKERTQELSVTVSQLRQEVMRRQEAEDAARKSERLFRAIFESARDCIFVKDQFLKYTLVNPLMEALVDMPASKIVGRTDQQLFGKQAAIHLREVDSRVMAGEYIEEEHTREIAGVPHTFHDIRVPLKDESGTIIGMCGISRDITERKRLVHAPALIFEHYPSPTFRSALADARLAATGDSIVLLLGESGSGKDHMARWIHSNSPRANGPYMSVNCAALPEELAESELFGHEPGAFTGAKGRLRGFLELAEGGTLLLNEIAELPTALQAKLLTFLDTRTFFRVGGREPIRVSARLMAATNRDIEREVEEGRFRRDLFYRLNVFALKMPSLRDRKEDIPMLVRQILQQLCDDLQVHPVPRVDPRTMDSLINYPWPGNIRELRNVLERALIISGGPLLTLNLTPSSEVEEQDIAWKVSFPPDEPLPTVVRDLRAKFVNEALRRADGNKQKAAELLRISRFTLRRQMKTLGMLESE